MKCDLSCFDEEDFLSRECSECDSLDVFIKKYPTVTISDMYKFIFENEDSWRNFLKRIGKQHNNA